MSGPRDLLVYYFEQAGANTSGDCAVEIQEIVDGIVGEAVEEAKREIIADLFCFTCGIPRTYLPERKVLLDSCDCDGYEPGAG